MLQMNNTITIEHGGAKIILPEKTVLSNYFASLQRPGPDVICLLNDEDIRAWHGAKEKTVNPPSLGQYWPGQGGIYAGLMRGEDGHPDYHLIVSPQQSNTQHDLEWGARSKDEKAATSSWNGLANTEALLQSKNSHPIVDWLRDLVIEGHSDWYVPARREASLAAANCPEAFEPGWHWTSTQYSANHAFVQYFSDGYQLNLGKGSRFRVRAVRRFIAN